MKTWKFELAMLMALLFFFATFSWAQDPVIFPAKGQSEEQVEKDKYDCYQWAKKESGFDPVNATPPPASTPAQTDNAGGHRIRGAARGAAVGAVTGAIAGDAGTGAAAGAAGGAMLAGMRKRRERREASQAQEQAAQSKNSQYNQNRGVYDRAFAACLEAKGYTVK